MRRTAAAIAIAFIASLTLASYGHCWPMFAVQMGHIFASHGHHGHEQQKLPVTPGPELAVPGMQTASPAIVPPAESKQPLLVVVANLAAANPVIVPARPVNNARAGPASFKLVHARTGRLLI